MYPILTIDKYNSIKENNISLVDKKEYEHNMMKLHIYDLNYNYDNIGEHNFCIETDFMKLLGVNHADGKIWFVVESHDNFFKNIINKVFEKIKIDINEKYSTNTTNTTFYSPVSTKDTLKIKLFCSDNKFSKNKTTIIYHNSKKQSESLGGRISNIVGESFQHTYSDIMKHSPMFNSKYYGNYGKNKCYYEGKFVLVFRAKVFKNCINWHSSIDIYAKEIEIKNTYQHIESILQKDIVNVGSCQSNITEKIIL